VAADRARSVKLKVSGKTGLSGGFARLPAAPDMASGEGALTKGRIGSILSPEPLQTLS
jgi:hypothetical protein